MKGKFPSERIAGCKLQPCGIGVYGKSPDFERFGAYSHKYKLSLPVSEETIQKFEEQEGIRLPEEYSAFLMYVGNGGAGLIMDFTEWKQIKRNFTIPMVHVCTVSGKNRLSIRI